MRVGGVDVHLERRFDLFGIISFAKEVTAS